MLFGIFCYHKCSHFNRVLTNEVGQRHRNRWRRYIVPILVSIDCGHMQDLEYIIPAHCLHSSLGYKMYRSHTCRTERAECGGFVYHDAAPSLVFFFFCVRPRTTICHAILACDQHATRLLFNSTNLRDVHSNTHTNISDVHFTCRFDIFSSNLLRLVLSRFLDSSFPHFIICSIGLFFFY